jgi:hypothetical protein
LRPSVISVRPPGSVRTDPGPSGWG